MSEVIEVTETSFSAAKSKVRRADKYAARIHGELAKLRAAEGADEAIAAYESALKRNKAALRKAAAELSAAVSAFEANKDLADMYGRDSKAAQSLRLSESEWATAAAARPPAAWAAAVSKIGDRALRARVANIVWWDFFGNRPASEPWTHLDEMREGWKAADEPIRRLEAADASAAAALATAKASKDPAAVSAAAAARDVARDALASAQREVSQAVEAALLDVGYSPSRAKTRSQVSDYDLAEPDPE